MKIEHRDIGGYLICNLNKNGKEYSTLITNDETGISHVLINKDNIANFKKKKLEDTIDSSIQDKDQFYISKNPFHCGYFRFSFISRLGQRENYKKSNVGSFKEYMNLNFMHFHDFGFSDKMIYFIGASYGVFEDALFTSLVLGTLIGTVGAIYKDVIQGGN